MTSGEYISSCGKKTLLLQKADYTQMHVSLEALESSEMQSDTAENGPVPTESERRSRVCRICHGCDTGRASARWSKPCRCRGTLKWVHSGCLMKWIEQREGTQTAEIACPVCKTAYVTDYGEQRNLLFSLVGGVKERIRSASLYVCFGLTEISAVWTAATYGAFTVMQVCGTERGLELLERANPALLLFLLPAIPVSLIALELSRWEELLWQKFLFRWLVRDSRSVKPAAIRSLHVIQVGPLLSKALPLPAIAVLTGSFLFGSVKSRLLRTLLGGATFTALKGAVRIYYKHQTFLARNNRVVKNFDQTPTPP